MAEADVNAAVDGYIVPVRTAQEHVVRAAIPPSINPTSDTRTCTDGPLRFYLTPGLS